MPSAADVFGLRLKIKSSYYKNKNGVVVRVCAFVAVPAILGIANSIQNAVQSKKRIKAIKIISFINYLQARSSVV